jgi:hypothetical protein
MDAAYDDAQASIQHAHDLMVYAHDDHSMLQTTLKDSQVHRA